MRKALKEYIYYLKINRNLSKNTIVAYENDISEYITFMERNYKVQSLNEVKSEYLKNYLQKLVRDKTAKSSEKRKLSAINSFTRYLLKEGRINADQVSQVSSPKIDKRIPTVLTRSEVESIIKVSKGDKPLEMRNYAMMEILYGSGLRISELTALNIEDIHLNVNLVNLFGKGSKERIVPLNNETVKALKDYILNARLFLNPKDRSAVFINRNGERISRVGVFKIIKKLALEAGIKKEISPHTFRHTFATHLLEGGADIMAVKELLGHEDVQTTEIYTNVSKKVIFDKYDEIEDNDNIAKQGDKNNV